MLFVIFVLPYTNEGPLWDYKITNEVTNCKASFWSSIFAVNNIFKADQSVSIKSNNFLPQNKDLLCNHPHDVKIMPLNKGLVEKIHGVP